MFMQHHNDTIIKTQWQRQTQEVFFNKIFTSHFIARVWKGCVWFYCERELESEHNFLVLQGCSTGALESTLLGAGFPYYNSSYSDSNCTRLYCLLFNSSALYYIQTPTRWCGHASTPPQFLPISGDRDVSLPLFLEWPVWSSSSGNNCHVVQRSLSSGASVYESIMGFFLPRLISSANFRPRDFLS